MAFTSNPRMLIAVSLIAGPAFVCGTACADADAERGALARLIHEIEALEPVITTAESQASPDTRIRFRYDWLRQDLGRIRSGIQEHIDARAPSRGHFRRYAATTGSEPHR